MSIPLCGMCQEHEVGTFCGSDEYCSHECEAIAHEWDTEVENQAEDSFLDTFVESRFDSYECRADEFDAFRDQFTDA